MSMRGDTAQNGGPPTPPKRGRTEGSKLVKRPTTDIARGTRKKRAAVRRNEQIVAERLTGRSARSLGVQFDLSTRQIYDICKEDCKISIADLEIGAPWRAQQFAEEYLLRLEEAINDARELELRAREQNNASLQLGAFKQRIKLESDQIKFLQETGLMTGPRNLKFDAEVAQFWNAVNTVCDEQGISPATRAAIIAAMAPAAGAEQSPPPSHWLRNAQEVEAAYEREAEAVRVAEAESWLAQEGARRREAEDKKIQVERQAEVWEREVAMREESRQRSDRVRDEIAEQEARREAQSTGGPTSPDAWPGEDFSRMTPEDLSRIMGNEAPIETRDPGSL